MSANRLARVTDNVWVDPLEVVAVRTAGTLGSYVHLYSGDAIHTNLSVAEVLDVLGVVT